MNEEYLKKRLKERIEFNDIKDSLKTVLLIFSCVIFSIGVVAKIEEINYERNKNTYCNSMFEDKKDISNCTNLNREQFKKFLENNTKTFLNNNL